MSKAPTHAVIDVGGIGYGLAISLQTFDQLPSVEEDGWLFTHLHVREDRMELFGFAAADEREVFELLIAVSGIGPNLALTILSGMTLRDLQDAILQERVNEWTQIKGIGRKTAERLIVDLRDRLDGIEEGVSSVVGTSSLTPEHDAVSALVALGYRQTDATRAIRGAATDGAGVEELIRAALASLSGART